MFVGGLSRAAPLTPAKHLLTKSQKMTFSPFKCQFLNSQLSKPEDIAETLCPCASACTLHLYTRRGLPGCNFQTCLSSASKHLACDQGKMHPSCQRHQGVWGQVRASWDQVVAVLPRGMLGRSVGGSPWRGCGIGTASHLIQDQPCCYEPSSTRSSHLVPHRSGNHTQGPDKPGSSSA